MSIELLKSLDPKALHPSALFSAFMAAPARGVPAFFPGVDTADEYWRAVIDRSRRARDAVLDDRRSDLAQSLVEYNSGLGAGSAILDKLERAWSDDVFFVVTGQQPGILGGALLVAYKIATAVVLARYLERRFSIECVPLYWCGSDDADFQEIRTFDCINTAFAPVSVSLPADAHAGGHPVGNIEKSRIATTWKSVSPVIEAYPFFPFVDERVTRSIARATDHGEVTAALMISLFGGEIAVVDGRSDCLKRSASDLYLDYFEREESVKAIVRERGIALRNAGYHAQLEIGPDSGIFLLEEGARRKVPAASRPLLREALRNRIERCTPGVILRTLIQDHLFCPLAAVIGPAEIAYRAQIHELYELFAIPAPAPVPRLSATYVPAAVADQLSRVSLQYEQFLEAPQALAELLSAEAEPQETIDAGRSLLYRISRDIEEYLSQVAHVLPGDAFKKYRTRVTDGRHRLERALGQIGEAGKLAAADRWPWLQHIEALVRSRNRPQERSLSLMIPFLVGGEGALKDLENLGYIYIDDLLDGKPAHYVYSLRS